jgi:hypothetical protein
MDGGYECTFNSAQGRNLVELKWGILPRFYAINFDVDALFARAVTSEVGEFPMPSLCLEDLVMVLCVHAAKHAWTQLSWLCDLVQLAKQSPDWPAIERRSADLGIERIVAVNFLLAHRLLNAGLPESIGKRMRKDRAVETLAADILPIVTRSAEYNKESINYFRLMMTLRERRRDRVKFLWRLVATPGAGDWSAIHLPAWLFPLYRLVRMFRLLGKLVGHRHLAEEAERG